MERKTLAIGIVVIIAIAAGTTGAVLYFLQPAEKGRILSTGEMYLPATIDPNDPWDSASNNVIRQVMEPLLTVDQTQKSLPLMPLLAADSWVEGAGWDVTKTRLTMDLRQGVKFHDGSNFDADDVIFTFDRMAYLYNFTGTNTGYVSEVKELYAYPNHSSIVKSITKVTQYQIIFNLRAPFSAFEPLLSYTASSICPDDDGGAITDPTYTVTNFIAPEDNVMVGTGPFEFENFDVGVEVVMPAFGDYWGGKAKIDKLVFNGIRDPNARNAALLAGDIDFLPDPMDEFWDIINGTSGLTLQLEPWKRSSVTSYLGMNTHFINRTWRKAISLAFDYDYLINTIRLGHCSRMKSPVPVSITYGNTSMNVFDTDIVLARRAMQEMGFGIGFNVNNDAQWFYQARTAPFRTFNYSYNIGNDIREDVFVLLSASVKRIGCTLFDAGSTWYEVLSKLYHWEGHFRDELELWWIGWGPDYNDPMNFINPLFTNKSIASNGAQYDGWFAAQEARLDTNYTASVNERYLWDNVQLLMEQAMVETNLQTRKQMYWRMQELLVERDYPWVYGYITMEVDAFDSGLKGHITEAMRNPYFYHCSW